MSLSAIDSYRTFTAEPKLRAEPPRHGAERRDERDAKSVTSPSESIRPQRLERALMSALESLKMGAPVASTGCEAMPLSATADTNPGIVTGTGPVVFDPVTDSAQPPASASSIKEAVHEFAHALAQALRGGERAERGGRGHYADIAKGLERLSQSATAPTQTSDDSEPVTEIQPIKVPVDVRQTGAVDSGIVKDKPSPVMPPTTDEPAPVTSATAAASSRSDRLLSAFSHLFDALQSNTAASGASVDYPSKLRDFLHTLGQALSPHGEAALPASGGLLNVTA